MRFTLFLAAVTAVSSCATVSLQAEDVYAIAAQKYSAGDFQGARDSFSEVIDARPAHAKTLEARFYLAESALQLGDLALARTRFAEFLSMAPRHPLANHALFHYGEANLMTGNAPEAQSALEEFLKRYPQDENVPVAQLRLAQALELSGNLEPSLKLFHGILAAKDERAAAARLGAGRVLYRLNRHAESLSTLTAVAWPDADEVASEATYWAALSLVATGRSREAVDLLDRMLEQNPKLAGADMLEYCAGLAWQQAGERAPAAERFERVGRDFPTSRWADASLKCRVQLAFETGDYERALSLSNEFIESFATSEQRLTVIQYRARAESKLKSFQSAEAAFRELIAGQSDTTAGAADPPVSTHWYYLAESQISRGAFADGLKNLAEARRRGLPENLVPDAIAMQAKALVGVRRTEEAISILSQWLQSHGKHQSAGICRSQLAIARGAAGKWHVALKELEQWVQSEPTNPSSLETMYALGELAYRQGDFPAALLFFDRLSSEEMPSEYQVEGLAGAAITRFATGDLLHSASAWEKILREHPAHPLAAQASFRRAKAFEQAGQDENAIAAYRLTARQFPQSVEASLALTAAARLASRSQDLDGAISDYRTLLQLDPRFEQRDAALSQLAALYDRVGRTQEADAIWLQLQKEYPDSHLAERALLRTAEMAVKRHDPGASSIVERMISSAGDPATKKRAKYLRGKLAVQDGDWPQVESMLQDLADDSAEQEYWLEARYWLAESAFRQGHWQIARERFDLLEVDGSQRTEAWLARVPLRRAQLLLQEKQYHDALGAVAKMNERFPDHANDGEVKLIVASCYAGLGRHEEARQTALSLAESASDIPAEVAMAAELLVADSLLTERHFGEALAHCEKVLAGKPSTEQCVTALWQSARCLESLERTDEAIVAYRKIAVVHKKSPLAADAERRLKAAEERLVLERSGRIRR